MGDFALTGLRVLAFTNAWAGPMCAMLLANMGAEAAIQADPSLAKGVNTYKGKLTYLGVAEAFGLEYTPLDTLL